MKCSACERGATVDLSLCPDCWTNFQSPLHVLELRARGQLDRALELNVKCQAHVDKWSRRFLWLLFVGTLAGFVMGAWVGFGFAARSRKETVQCEDG